EVEEIQVVEEVEFVYENEDAIIREEIDAIIQKNVMNEELESADEENINVIAKKLDVIDEEEI
ncbi:17840_t:CDS:1, partial [Cetraspora pellucida]